MNPNNLKRNKYDFHCLQFLHPNHYNKKAPDNSIVGLLYKYIVYESVLKQSLSSTILGRTHGPSYHLWQVGEPASAGVRKFVETGVATMMERDNQGSGDILDMFDVPAIFRGVGTMWSSAVVDSKHPMVCSSDKVYRINIKINIGEQRIYQWFKFQISVIPNLYS